QNRFLLAAFSLIVSCPMALRGQDKMPVKFGKVTPDDFNVTAAGLDSSSDVVVVADYGTSSFEGNAKGWFDLDFHRSKRMRILKRTGFDAATVTIPLYVDGSDGERLSGLKAATYTLEDGKVVETKLDGKSVFTDKISKHWIEEKFTFPALKEGAVLEYSYTVVSPFLSNLQPWDFQGPYPCLWSEYQVDMPNFFKYATLAQGYLPFKINTSDSRSVDFRVTIPGGAGADDHGMFSDYVVTHRWVMANIPALKEEPFTTTTDNYVSKIEFQLSGIQFPQSSYHDRMGNWFQVCDGLMKDDGFGGDLARSNSWLDEDMKNITKGASGNLEKAQKIFSFVRDNFTCTSHGSLELSNPLKTIYKNKSGNEADLNLLLTAMMIHAGLKAKPVILSTRSNGFVHSFYPLLTRYNYVISQATIDSVRYCLDASEPWLGFGRLPMRCYNGEARVVDKDAPYIIALSADSLTEGKVTMAIISNNDKGGLDARVQSMPGGVESSVVRSTLTQHGQQEFLKTLQAGFSGDATVSDVEIDSLRQPDKPLGISYDLHLNVDSSSDTYYFSPMLGEAYRENPFKAANRTYPVEMPYAMDETYTLTMEVPTGYVVDELPKSARVLFNSDEGLFEYLIQADKEHVQFRTRIKLKKANFAPEDYSSLRDFFGYIVKKQQEQIVFKKKK
ncbi:MAG TPA: transglutaminase domain-containing protein, partial [Puia sp.]|nr:transglutaminase domain-containing protein [Puia sp.]